MVVKARVGCEGGCAQRKTVLPSACANDNHQEVSFEQREAYAEGSMSYRGGDEDKGGGGEEAREGGADSRESGKKPAALLCPADRSRNPMLHEAANEWALYAGNRWHT